jgi:hypothetical protein
MPYPKKSLEQKIWRQTNDFLNSTVPSHAASNVLTPRQRSHILPRLVQKSKAGSCRGRGRGTSRPGEPIGEAASIDGKMIKWIDFKRWQHALYPYIPRFDVR